MSATSRVSTHTQPLSPVPKDQGPCICRILQEAPVRLQSKVFRARKCSVSLIDYFSPGPMLSVHQSCLTITVSHQATLEPWQLLMGPSLMSWAGGWAERWGDVVSATFRQVPCRHHCAFGQHTSKGPRLTYLFNFDYTAQLPSGNER